MLVEYKVVQGAQVPSDIVKLHVGRALPTAKTDDDWTACVASQLVRLHPKHGQQLLIVVHWVTGDGVHIHRCRVGRAKVQSLEMVPVLSAEADTDTDMILEDDNDDGARRALHFPDKTELQQVQKRMLDMATGKVHVSLASTRCATVVVSNSTADTIQHWKELSRSSRRSILDPAVRHASAPNVRATADVVFDESSGRPQSIVLQQDTLGGTHRYRATLPLEWLSASEQHGVVRF